MIADPGQQPIPDPGAAAEIDAVFERQRRLDGLGHRIHAALAVLACVLIGGPMVAVQTAIVPLAVCFLIRIWGIHPIVGRFGRTALARLLLAWVAWCGASFLWSMDIAQSGDEFSDLRWVAMPFMLWAVLDRRRWLVGALAAGLAMGAAAAWVRELWPELLGGPARWGEDRISGWWHPVVGGSILTAALGLHLPAALLGRGRARVVGIIGAAAMGAGVLATGTRGAWIASAALVALGVVWAVVKSARARGEEHRGGALRIAAGAGVAAVAIGAAIWIGAGGAVERRLARGIEEVRAALTEGDFESDTGARLRMAGWALEAMAERPIQGVGLGAYRAWVSAHLAGSGDDPSARDVHGHAHNAALEIGATLGVVGLGIAVAIVVLVLRGEMRRAGPALAAGGAGGAGAGVWGVYDLGPAWALVGMVLVSAFDPVHLNAQSAPVLWVLIALCAPGRPSPVGRGPSAGVGG